MKDSTNSIIKLITMKKGFYFDRAISCLMVVLMLGSMAVANATPQAKGNRDFYEEELGYTTYDWQSNSGARTWTHVWPDGKVSFAYTSASNLNYSDRGTAIDTYDPATGEWTLSGGRVENVKTGFGSIAQYGENGIVVAAHTPTTQCGIFLIEDKDNIVPNSVPMASALDPTYDVCWPSVMTSGANRSIIHVVATTAYGNIDIAPGVTDPILYFRSQDGGLTWDKENVILPFMGPEYAVHWGSNVCYWMETTEDNCLALVVNNGWSDGMVIYSYDDGETWERKVFYKHPDPFNYHEDFFCYPRWTSCQWDSEHNLHVLYEFNATVGDPGSGSFYPSMGGVAYWNETMPYNVNGTTVSAIEGNLTPGEPFVMDADYLKNDIYRSWWNWEEASHVMWPEYVGYLSPLDENGVPENPYDNEGFSIEDYSAHGEYNSGVCAFPVLCIDPDTQDLIAIWCGMNENCHWENEYLYNIFGSRSRDGGQTWSKMVNLSSIDWIWSWNEYTYPQAAVVNGKLVVACQVDYEPGTYVQSQDYDFEDNHYHGFVFDIEETFGDEPFSYNPKYRISVSVNNEYAGTVTGGGKYEEGETCTLTATVKYGFEFINWTKDGVEVSTEPEYSFEVMNGGTYIANFQLIEGNVCQLFDLNSGWTWWTTAIELNGMDGLSMLENGLGESGVMITSQASGFVQNYGTNGWYGSLESINNENMYRVKSNNPCTFAMVGQYANPADHPITVYNGWTYMGYMATSPMYINDALANLEASDGDIIKSQSAFANYYENAGWFGSLTMLKPGQGLMYKSVNDEEVTFTYPEVERGMAVVDEMADNNHWTVDMHDYEYNMTVMAVVEIEGNEVYSSDYELAAFADGVCRGSAKLIYVEPIDRYVAFLTIGGHGSEELSFGLYNATIGEERFDSDNSVVFAADAMVGDFDNPLVVNFRGNTGINDIQSVVRMYPNPINAGGCLTIEVADNQKVYVEIIDALGAVVAKGNTNRIMAPKTAGVYMLKVTVDGKATQIVKLIVR